MLDMDQLSCLCCEECGNQLEEIEDIITDEENRCRFITYYKCENCEKIYNY